ncbi:unnamed protein product [Moneuplotes crassus]|uniref:EF-hand domain-containing protein n=1 Tax=Euplotes crassus TaxID=5936 RepID=A0AAD1X9F6_EUPCR|nr:unnamed protein product [Moneuplotes crassus]
MLSVESSTLLRSLLTAIAQGEISIEKQRKKLGKLVKYEPYCAFQRIDRRRTGYVSSKDILAFLRDNEFQEETEADTYYLMKFFDVDEDCKLNYTEFLTLVLPCDNAKLRNEIIMRPNFYVGLLDFLPKTIEYELCKLFVKEIAFHSRIENIKQELASKPDFDSKSGFKTIDDWNYNYIDFSNLKRFLKSTGHIATNKELAAIIRRLDLNADSRLSFEEFDEGIKPIEPYSKVTSKNKSKAKIRPNTAKLRSKKLKSSIRKKKVKKRFRKIRHAVTDPSCCDKRSIEQYAYSQSKAQSSLPDTSKPKAREGESTKEEFDAYRSPSEAKLGYDSNPYHKSSSYFENYELDSRYGYPERMHTSVSPRHAKEPIMYSPRNPPDSMPEFESTLTRADERELVSALKDLLEMEEDLEKYKIDLSLMPDFNLIDLFRTFDTTDKGYITFDEFRSGMHLFSVHPSEEEALLLFTRYETVEKGTLTFGDFSNIFCPKDKECSLSLKARKAFYINKQYKNLNEYFNPETRHAVENLLTTNIRVESCVDTIKDHLSLLPCFSAMEAFNTIDMNNNGYLDKKQFSLLLEAHGIYSKNCEYLVDRFDKQKNGKVSFREFSDGFRKY